MDVSEAGPSRVHGAGDVISSPIPECFGLLPLNLELFIVFEYKPFRVAGKYVGGALSNCLSKPKDCFHCFGPVNTMR